MSFENVQLPYARNEYGEIINIREIPKESKEHFYCPVCGSSVRKKQGDTNEWHFAHEDKSECSSETRIHFWVKNELIKKGTQFIIKSDIEKQYICKDVLIEKTYDANGKPYTPDLTVITENGETIFFEMEYSNAKKLEEYLDKWIVLGKIVVQVDTKSLINSSINSKLVFDALWYDGKCFNVKKGEDKLYYNTIGKYKEKIMQNGEYDRRLNEIKKLDWFWRDVVKYKNAEVDIYHMEELISSIENEEDRRVILEVLKNKSCNNLILQIEELKNKNMQFLLENSMEYIKKSIGEDICDFDKEIHFEINNNFNKIYDKLFSNYVIDMYYKGEHICQFDKTTNLENEILKIKNEIQEIKEMVCRKNIFEQEIDTYLKAHENIKEKISIENNKISLSNFYKTRDLVFIIYDDYVEYMREYWSMHNYKSNLIHETIEKYFFTKYDYLEAFGYINFKTDEIVRKRLSKIKSEEKNREKKVIPKKVNRILQKIYKIIENSPDHIKEYNTSYLDSNNEYLNSIKLQDYKGKYYIICDKEFLCNDEVIDKKYRIININKLNDYQPIYMSEYPRSYKLSNSISLSYKYEEYLLGKYKVYFSFKKYDDEYIYLPRYNFVEATHSLEKIREEVKKLVMEEEKKIEKNNKVINCDYIKNEEIDKRIKLILYPIIYQSNFKKGDILKIQLNIDFTKDNKYKPWLIKDFINELCYIFDNFDIENKI